MSWNIYLSGEIHTEWRDEIKKKASKEKMNINFTEPVWQLWAQRKTSFGMTIKEQRLML